MLAVIAALVMMLRRAPTELMAGLASSVRVRRREPSTSRVTCQQMTTAIGRPAMRSCPPRPWRRCGDGTSEANEAVRSLKVRRLEPPELRARDNKPMRPGRAKGGYKCRHCRCSICRRPSMRRSTRPRSSAAPACSSRSSPTSASTGAWSRFSRDRWSRCTSSSPARESRSARSSTWPTTSRWRCARRPCESRRRCRARRWSESRCPIASARRSICARSWKPRSSRPPGASSRLRWARISPGVRWRPIWRRCRIC